MGVAPVRPFPVSMGSGPEGSVLIRAERSGGTDVSRPMDG